jgi:hypothetical protein
VNTDDDYRAVASAIDLDLPENVGRDEGIATILTFLKLYPEKTDIALGVLASLEPEPPSLEPEPPGLELKPPRLESKPPSSPPARSLAQLLHAIELEALYALTSEKDKRWLWAYYQPRLKEK